MLPMHLRTIFLILCFAGGNVVAQNLVPNESFEDYNNCPSSLLSMPFTANYSNFPSVTDWTNPVRLSSPDYLNVCATTGSGLKLPNSVFGYQQPHSGNAYAGIIAWEANILNGNVIYDYREYLQNKLIHPMQAGKQYCVTFYVSPTINPGLQFNFISIDEVGINFSPNRTIDTQSYVLGLSYHVRNTPGKFLTDTSKWYKVTGVYTASGGEEWLTLGCFKSGTAPVYIPAYPANPVPNVSYRTYMFIDDISVREITAADTMTSYKDTTVCQPNGLQILLSGEIGASAYLWSNGTSSATLVAHDTGTYWCKSILACGLQIDTFHLVYNGPHTLDLGPDTVNCQSQPVTLQANQVYDTYNWSTGAQTSSIVANTSGIYILTVSDKCGVQRDTIEVTIQTPTPAPLPHDTVVCQFDIMPKLTVEGSGIKWYGAGGGSATSVQPYIYTTQYGDQVVYVTQTIGKCESPKVPLHIKVRYKPDADIGDYYSFCEGQDTLIGRIYPDVNYLWNTNESVCCIQPRQTGTYELTISNDCGISSDTAFVEISSCDECLVMPNAFTPNNDGRNDIFNPVIKCPVSNYAMNIYNRWGERVFTTNDVTKGWNGIYNNRDAPLGAYVYIIQYRSENTRALKHLQGNFLLVR